ncbi:MAG: PIN domain-containing protein [Acidobacteria bacterium]|nr:PIN domain-containing protein [Acidobacteriota bacterium]
MRVLIDTDVLIDVAPKRTEFFRDSNRVLEWIETGGGQAAVAWHSVSNLAYMMTDARGFIRDLLQFIEIAPGSASEVLAALDLPMKDLEDAMQAAAARSFNAAWLITRNVDDYKKSPVPAISPSDFLEELALTE